MDGIPPNTPQPREKKVNKFILGALIVFVIIIILLVLNFFNILPLSIQSPNQLGGFLLLLALVTSDLNMYNIRVVKNFELWSLI